MNPILEKYNEVNAFGKLLGMQMKLITPGEVEYRMRIKHQHLSNPVAAHGGAVAAMMDAVLGVAALSLSVEERMLVSTVEFKINFYAPVKAGDMLVGKGKVVFAGNRLISSEGSIFCENKKMVLVCKGLGTFNTYPVAKHALFSEEN